MTEIHFYITEQAVNDMETEDYEAFERAQDGDFKLYRVRPALCRFMVDAANKPVPYEQALKISGKMKISHIKDFLETFFKTIQAAAIPKASGSPSSSPTEVKPTDSPSQPGS
jgi:hypothetical protein